MRRRRRRFCSTSKDGTSEGVRGEEDGYVFSGSFFLGGGHILNLGTSYFILIFVFFLIISTCKFCVNLRSCNVHVDSFKSFICPTKR